MAHYVDIRVDVLAGPLTRFEALRLEHVETIKAVRSGHDLMGGQFYPPRGTPKQSTDYGLYVYRHVDIETSRIYWIGISKGIGRGARAYQKTGRRYPDNVRIVAPKRTRKATGRITGFKEWAIKWEKSNRPISDEFRARDFLFDMLDDAKFPLRTAEWMKIYHYLHFNADYEKRAEVLAQANFLYSGWYLLIHKSRMEALSAYVTRLWTREPLLEDLYDEVRSHVYKQQHRGVEQSVYCANLTWIDVIKPKLVKLVGHNRPFLIGETMNDGLCTSFAYDACSEVYCDLLPNCRGCLCC